MFQNLLFLIIFYCFYFLVKGLQVCILLLKKVHIDFYELFHKKNTLLYLENFPIENAGYQYRAFKWRQLIFQKGISAEIDTVYEQKKDFDRIYSSIRNMYNYFIVSMFKKLRSILFSYRYETVIVRREILLFNDYGKLFYQKLILALHPNVILDFDDNISASKNEPREIKSMFGVIMQESGAKFYDSVQMNSRFIVGSTYLKEFVLSCNKRAREEDICIIPTCVDYQKYYYKKYANNEKIALGWIGGNSNLTLLKTLFPVLNAVSKKYPIKLIVISGKEVTDPVDFEIENIPWSLNTEIDEMYKIDVGLMPIENDEVSKGKCGFKLIQYMGLGIVSIASGVTINNEIVNDGVDSFLVKSKDEWQTVIEKCLAQRSSFQEIGRRAKESIHSRYTFEANVDKYVNFLQKSRSN